MTIHPHYRDKAIGCWQHYNKHGSKLLVRSSLLNQSLTPQRTIAQTLSSSEAEVLQLFEQL